MDKTLSIILRLCIVLILLTSTGCRTRIVDRQQVAKDERIVIRFSHVVAENTPKGLAAKKFAELVRERTNGYVEVQVFPESTLYKDGEELKALRNGEVQILAPATSKLSELSPEWQVLDLPYAFQNSSSFHAFIDGPAGLLLFEKLQSYGFLALAVWDNGFKQITNNKRPLIYPKDFRGLSFRVMPSSRLLIDQFNVFGGSAKPMPFSDVYRALKDGDVDGQENSISNIYTKEFSSLQRYLTLSNHGYLAYIVITNAQFWNSLPDWIKNVLQETMAEVELWEREKAKELNEEQLRIIRQQGRVEIHTLSEGERQIWESAFEPLYSKLEKEVNPELIKYLRQLKEKTD